MKRAVAYANLNGGIWSAELRGRTDLARYPSAATDSLNCFALTLGPVTRRPGMHDIAATEGNAAAMLGRFVFNDDQAYILEWTPGWLRLIQRGAVLQSSGTPYRVASPYQASHLSAIRSAQSADIVYLACRDVRPHKLSRYGQTNWTLEPIVFRDGPYRDPWPGMPAVTLAGNTMTFGAAAANADWVGQCIRFQIDGSWYWRRITAVASPTSITAVVEPGADVPGLAGELLASFSIVVDAEGSNGEVIPIPAPWQPVMSADNLRITVNTLTLTPTLHYTVVGGTEIHLTQPALPHVTVTVVNEALAGEAPEVVTGMISNWRAPAWGGQRGWPSCVALFEQRTWWAGTEAEPLSIWASVTGDYETFSPTETDAKVLDDNGLYLIAADQEVSQIQWMMPGDNIWFGTAGGEYICRSSELSEALTAANANIRPQTTEGSAPVEPIRIDSSVVFVSRGRKGVHTLTFDPDADGMITPDLAQLAQDVTDAGVVQLAWCRLPNRLLWCLLADGTLASLTHAPRDQVNAWHRHAVQDGKVLSIASVPEEAGDVLYLVTERTGPDGVTRRRIERMADRWKPLRGETDARRAMFLDAARSRVGTNAVTSLTGLDHLNGRIVHVMADGAAIPPRMVVDGAITLDKPASIIHAGLPVAYFHVTSDIDTGGPIGTGQARNKALAGLEVLVYATVGASIQVIVDGKPSGRSTPVPMRQAQDPMDTAPQLVSDWVPVDIANAVGKSLRLRIEGQDALPATILCLAIQTNVNER